MTRIRLSPVLLAALLVSATACGQWRMVNTETRVRAHARAGEYEQALRALQARDGRSYKAQDSVVYSMNEGMLLQQVGRHRAAIASLSRAERRAKELFTRSVSRQVKATFTSDAALDYPGEDHEKVLLNVVKSLSFLALNDRAGALVEARKINRKLEYFNTVYQSQGKSRGKSRGKSQGRSQGNAYAEDAFAHWLMGMLFEMEGSHDDARIAFADALRVYREQFRVRYDLPVPGYVAEDLARAAIASGATDVLERVRADSKDPQLGQSAELRETGGEIVVVHLSGEGPTKTDFDVTCRFRDKFPTGCNFAPGGDSLVPRALARNPREQSVTVSFPKLVTRAPTFAHLAVRAAGERTVSEPALPINRIARETLRDRLPRIFKGAVVRAIAKASSRAVAARANDKLKGRSKAGWLLGFAIDVSTDVATRASEEADKRTWSTLPGRVEVARLWVPAGTHDVTLALPGGETVAVHRVHVEAGERVFLAHRTGR